MNEELERRVRRFRCLDVNYLLPVIAALMARIKPTLLPALLIGALCILIAVRAVHRRGFVRPPANLVLEEIPPIPLSVAAQANRYELFSGARMFAWSPVWREMLVGSRSADTWQVFRLSAPGGDARQVTAYRDPILSATYEPDSTDAFIFPKDSEGDEQYQIYRYDRFTRNATLLTDGKSRNTNALFEHHGSRLAYTSNRRNGVDSDLYLVDAQDKGTDHLVARLSGDGWFPLDFSQDGKRLLISYVSSVNKSELYVADLGSGALKKISPEQTPAEPVYYGSARFSKDGKGVYVVTDRDSDFRRLAYFDSVTLTTHFLTDAIHGDVASIQASEDGRRIAFLTNENGVSRLYVLDTSTGRYRAIDSIPAGVIEGIDLHANGRDLGFTLTSAKIPSDIFSVDITTGKLTRWTYGTILAVKVASIREPRLVAWKSFDGLTISGLLYQPDPLKFPGKRPVIIEIHGGPEDEARPRFLSLENYFINELGVAILLPNVRGSTGFGKTFNKLDNGFLRDHAFKDIGALLDWIPGQPNLDPGHVMVTGASYGGTMAWAVAAFYNDKISCALAKLGSSNLVTFLEHTEAYRRDERRAEYGDERVPAMRAYLESIAPMNHVDLMHKPIFAVVGKNDPRVPWTESRQIIDKLRAQGTPAWFMLANDEGHGYRKNSNRIFEFDATVMFVRKYLLGLD